jgi:hypothetical protein
MLTAPISEHMRIDDIFSDARNRQSAGRFVDSDILMRPSVAIDRRYRGGWFSVMLA